MCGGQRDTSPLKTAQGRVVRGELPIAESIPADLVMVRLLTLLPQVLCPGLLGNAGRQTRAKLSTTASRESL